MCWTAFSGSAKAWGAGRRRGRILWRWGRGGGGGGGGGEWEFVHAPSRVFRTVFVVNVNFHPKILVYLNTIGLNNGNNQWKGLKGRDGSAQKQACALHMHSFWLACLVCQFQRGETHNSFVLQEILLLGCSGGLQNTFKMVRDFICYCCFKNSTKNRRVGAEAGNYYSMM